jgi:hypothetical protein
MRKAFCALSISAALAMPGIAVAQEDPARPNTGGLSISGGVDYTTAYFFRGYNQEDSGLIFQPYAELGINLFEGESMSLSANLGIWNSFHENQTTAVSGPSSWYESDLYGGLDLTIAAFTIGTVYTFYTYPNGAFETIQEVGVVLSYDDSDLMANAPFTLSPYIGIYYETRDGNGTQDTYAEAGISPSFAIGDSGISISFPLALGLGLDDYYFDDDGDDELLGYGSIAMMASVPLPMPSRYGSWELVGGLQYLHLFAESAEASNNGDRDEFIGKVGVNFSFDHRCRTGNVMGLRRLEGSCRGVYTLVPCGSIRFFARVTSRRCRSSFSRLRPMRASPRSLRRLMNSSHLRLPTSPSRMALAGAPERRRLISSSGFRTN